MPAEHKIIPLIAGLAFLTLLPGATFAQAAPVSSSPAIQYKISSLRQTRKGYYAVRVNYPIFEGNSPLSKEASTTIRSDLAQNVKGFIKDAVKAHGTPFNQPWFLGIDTNVGLARAGLISLCFTVHGYFGGATDTLSPETYTFGLRNGQPTELSLSDIFAKPPDPTQTLSQFVMPILKQKKAAFVLDGTVKSLADAGGSWGWYLDGSKTFTVVIAEGIVGSHADGPFTVNIPLSQLFPKFKIQGPLSALFEK